MVDLFCRAVSDKKDWRTQPGNGLLNQLVLRPILRSVIAHNFGDAQPVIGEHAAPPQRLDLSMPEMIALRRDATSSRQNCSSALPPFRFPALRRAGSWHAGGVGRLWGAASGHAPSHHPCESLRERLGIGRELAVQNPGLVQKQVRSIISK
jgi:hypothetical protein